MNKKLLLLGATAGVMAGHSVWRRAHQRDLSGLVVLITGGSTGIGKLMALKFAQEKCTVVLWARTLSALEDAAAEIRVRVPGSKVHIYCCDVSDPQQVADCATVVQKEVGDVSVLVNNAALVSGKYIIDSNIEEMKKTLETNVLAHFATVKAFLPGMLKNNFGHIVTISSAGGIVGAPGLADYTASKFAVFGFNETLRLELKKQFPHKNIRTTCVCPYFISTEMFKGVRTYSSLLPILQPDAVAARVVTAVKNGDEQVVMPWFVNNIFLSRYLFSIPLFDKMMQDILKVSSCMDTFVGHPEKKITPTDKRLHSKL